MTAEIVTLFKKANEVIIWQCACGCMTFKLHYEDGVECTDCGGFIEGLACVYSEPPDDPEDGEAQVG